MSVNVNICTVQEQKLYEHDSQYTHMHSHMQLYKDYTKEREKLRMNWEESEFVIILGGQKYLVNKPRDYLMK